MQCLLCHKEYASPVSLRTHVLNVHEKVRYVCFKCDKTFASDGARSNHMDRSHIVPPIKYECTLCKKYYTTKYCCLAHIRKAHQVAAFTEDAYLHVD